MEILGTKRFIPKGFELGTTSVYCCIFGMKHATGMETSTKIYFLFIFNLMQISQNLAILTLQLMKSL